MGMTASAIQARYGALAGARIGDLTFAGLAHQRGDNSRLIGRFVCACGNTVQLPAGRVLNGRSRRHCGCQTDYGKSRTHGMRGSPEYSSWCAMKARCLDPNNKDFPRWGGRGVTIHAAWIESFEAFFAYIGRRPAGTTLDRIDNRRGYEPGNVQWATGEQQQTNRRSSYTVEIAGITYRSMEAAGRACGVSAMTIIRWCDGYADQRRADQDKGGIVAARAGCRRWRTYAP